MSDDHPRAPLREADAGRRDKKELWGWYVALLAFSIAIIIALYFLRAPQGLFSNAASSVSNAPG